MKELVFENTLHRSNGGFIDGPCKLPMQINWPIDSESAPLFHLISFPLQWVVSDSSDQKFAKKWISVFISYDKLGYTHYGKMSSDEPNHTDSMVIMHDMTGPERSEHPSQSSTSKNVKLKPAIDGDANVASHIGSSPTWVQDPINLDGIKWVLSIYGPDMDEALGDNAGILSDGVGYIFIFSEIDVNSTGVVGKFFFQL